MLQLPLWPTQFSRNVTSILSLFTRSLRQAASRLAYSRHLFASSRTLLVSSNKRKRLTSFSYFIAASLSFTLFSFFLKSSTGEHQDPIDNFDSSNPNDSLNITGDV